MTKLEGYDQLCLDLALREAELSYSAGGIPIGALLVDEHRNVLGRGHNERVQSGDPVAHGEIVCLRNAGRLTSYQLATLYTTLSPCQMCSGAILLFRIPRVVVGEAKTFVGNLEFLESSGVEVLLADDDRCIGLMSKFQEDNPQLWLEDIGSS